MLFAEDLHLFGNRATAEIRSAANDNARRFATCVGIDDLDVFRAHHGSPPSRRECAWGWAFLEIVCRFVAVLYGVNHYPFHEPTHPRPLPGGEQAFVSGAKVPLLGGVRGGFIVTNARYLLRAGSP